MRVLHCEFREDPRKVLEERRKETGRKEQEYKVRDRLGMFVIP